MDSVEQSLNGGYAALYGEIVDYDCFHLKYVPDAVSCNDPSIVHWHGHDKGFNFEPKVIYDLGANVGIFSRYAKSLFPDARLICVEPDEDNFSYLSDIDAVKFKKAIGIGKVYRMPNAVNGAHEAYLNECKVFNKENFISLDEKSIETVMPSDLIAEFGHEDSIMKVDIEGNEAVIFDHKPSIEAMKKINYLVVEIHYYFNTGEKETIYNKAKKFMDSFKDTHRCNLIENFFYASK